MIKSFLDKASEDIAFRRPSKHALKALPFELHEKARIKLAKISAAQSLRDLQELKGNRLEALRGDRRGQYSIRINDKYRICFVWKGDSAFDVQIVDYH